MGTVMLLRHAQASFGAENYDRLSAVGQDQAVAVGEWLANLEAPPDVLLVGGMVRHSETAQGLMQGANWSLPTQVDPRWDEFDGIAMVAALPDSADLDLTDRATFQAAYLRATARWVSGQHDQDYPEAWPEFVARVSAALDDAAALAGPGQRVLVVSSGGPIALALARGLDPRAMQVPVWNSLMETMVNTGISRLLVGRRGFKVSTVNEHQHLDEPTYR